MDAAGPTWEISVFAGFVLGNFQTKVEFLELKNHLGKSRRCSRDTALKNMNDPIADLIIRIKNAGDAGKESVSVPFSKMKLAIAELLSSKGFVGAVEQKSRGEANKSINIGLLYAGDGKPRISDVKRISKPSRRLYQKSKEIKQYRRGFGMVILSTPKGIMADAAAKKENVGGEILFSIW